MTSILFLTEAIYCNIFRCNYLRKEKYFLHFINLDSILNVLKKYVTMRDVVFLILRTPKHVVRQMSKKFHFRRPSNK